jgi:hypothetical protein
MGPPAKCDTTPGGNGMGPPAKCDTTPGGNGMGPPAKCDTTPGGNGMGPPAKFAPFGTAIALPVKTTISPNTRIAIFIIFLSSKILLFRIYARKVANRLQQKLKGARRIAMDNGTGKPVATKSVEGTIFVLLTYSSPSRTRTTLCKIICLYYLILLGGSAHFCTLSAYHTIRAFSGLAYRKRFLTPRYR